MGGYSPGPTPSSGFAFDEVGTEKHQRVKVQIGKDGKATDVSFAAPMPTSDLVLHFILEKILLESRLTNLYLSRIANENLTVDDIEDY